MIKINVHEFQFVKHQKRLKVLLEEIFSKIPMYKKQMIQTPSYYTENYENWTSLPFTLKKSIQKDFTSYVNIVEVENSNDAIVMHTSGSTGIPLQIIKDKKEELRLTKRLWKYRREYNKKIMEKKLLYLYRNIESENLNILRMGNDDYLDLSEEELGKAVPDIQKFEPYWIIGSPSTVYRLANYYSKTNKTIESIQIVELFGEMLFPHQKNLIENVFNCRVINHYGSREFGVMSYECPEGNMHAWSDDLFFEVLKDGIPVEDGETGELVVTSLKDRFMPLIRYKIEDAVQIKYIKSQCSCGKPSIYLTPISGRIAQFLKTPSKTLPTVMFDTEFSSFIIKNPNSIKEFQVIQENLDNVNILIVIDRAFKESDLITLNEAFEKYATDISYNFKIVNKIELDSSGKTKTFISKLDGKGDEYDKIL